MAERGASINNYPLPVRSLAVASLELGGDTSITIEEGKICFTKRQGPALCVGGPTLTVTDILVYSGYSTIASRDLIKEQVEAIAAELQLTPEQFSEQVLVICRTVRSEIRSYVSCLGG